MALCVCNSNIGLQTQENPRSLLATQQQKRTWIQLELVTVAMSSENVALACIYLSFRQSLTTLPQLAWNSPYRQGWPQMHRDLTASAPWELGIRFVADTFTH